MNTHRHSAASIARAVVIASVVLAGPALSRAQSTSLPKVPKGPCCFNNFRYSGTCQVTPRQGQYCQNILSYLNNFNSSGENYCDSTYIRGGWAEVDCASGDSSGPVGTMKPSYVDAQEPTTAPVESSTSAGSAATRAVEPGTLKVSEPGVIEVRLDQPLDVSSLTAGQQLTGLLEADLVDPDGSVLLPAGSTVSAVVGAGEGWDEAAAGGASLRLVGTATSAADLFGTAEPSGAVPTAAGPSVHLTGDSVQLSDDSVVTFKITDLSDQPADLRVLTTATKVWMDAFNSGDAVTIAGLASESGALLPPNGRAVIGRDAIYDYWKSLLADSGTRLELVNIETVVEGDLGYKAGRFKLVDSETGAEIDEGKYIQIWKRSPDGIWELHRDMWNSSVGSGS